MSGDVFFPPIVMRAPCKGCGGTDGEIRKKSDQNCVYCRGCGKYAGYNAPKRETGEPQAHVASRPDIKPSQRARVISRDGARCVLCGRTPPDVLLHVGHVLSVKQGRELGATDAEIFDDRNLVAQCAECNLGLRDESLEPIIWLRLLRARTLGGAK